jgi:ribosomal protein S18 acetylase RimI-like enzyme
VRPGARGAVSFAGLDNAVFTSLSGHHRHLALRQGRAVRDPPAISTFAALPDRPQLEDWDDLGALAQGTDSVLVARPVVSAPPGWARLSSVTVVQMIDGGVAGRADGDVVTLSADDVPEITDLVADTRPGPFAARTIDMGRYLGLRERGRLVAMAGERFHPPGWTEISAVCTAPDHRGRGLATRLMLTLAHGIRRRGERPFLHVATANTSAIKLYTALGFVIRQEIEVVELRPR